MLVASCTTVHVECEYVFVFSCVDFVNVPFLTVDAIIGNQAFQNERCHICFSLGLDKVETGIICWWSKMQSPNA